MTNILIVSIVNTSTASSSQALCVNHFHFRKEEWKKFKIESCSRSYFHTLFWEKKASIYIQQFKSWYRTARGEQSTCKQVCQRNPRNIFAQVSSISTCYLGLSSTVSIKAGKRWEKTRNPKCRNLKKKAYLTKTSSKIKRFLRFRIGISVQYAIHSFCTYSILKWFFWKPSRDLERKFPLEFSQTTWRFWK